MGFWSEVWLSLKKVSNESSEELGWARTLKDDGLSMLQIKIRNYLRTASAEERNKKASSLSTRSHMSSTTS